MMTKGTKIWLWFALVLCMGTTGINLVNSRWISVAIALVALVGLCVLLFSQRKWGYFLMCVCYALSFAEGVRQGIIGESGLMSAIIMSFIGAALVPLVTYAFLRRNWRELR